MTDIRHTHRYLVPEQPSSLTAELWELRAEIDLLPRVVRSRAQIEQAKGAIMARYGMDEEHAVQLLRRWSSLSRIKTRIVARTVMDLLSTAPQDQLAEQDFVERLTRRLAEPGIAELPAPEPDSLRPG